MFRTKTYFNFFKTQTTRYYGSWNKIDLPILPRVAFAHKTLKEALNKCEDVIPKIFCEDLRRSLDEIRSINWNYYNTADIDLMEAQQAKIKLQKLINFEKKLPEQLAKQLRKVPVFESLQGAIDCLDDRVGNVLLIKYNK